MEPLELGDEPLHGAGSIGELPLSNPEILSSPTRAAEAFTNQLSVIIGFITLLGSIFFVIYFLLAAFDWIRAGDNKGDVDKAKSKMTNAAIGMFIMVMAVGIVGLIGGVVGIDVLNPVDLFEQLVPNNSSAPGVGGSI